jgi:hypothetical protein
MVLNVSNDEPAVTGETDEQRQLREQRNADRAGRRQHEAEEKKHVAGDPDLVTWLTPSTE